MKIISTIHGLLLLCVCITLQAASIKKPFGYVSTFLQTADQLKTAADEMMSEIIPEHSRAPSTTTQELSGKKKALKHSRLPSLRKKKKHAIPNQNFTKTVLQQSDPTSMYLNGQIPLEQISDTYLNALTFYTECINKCSLITGIYIRMQMAHILQKLTQMHAPADLFSPTTVFEPGYKEIIMQSKFNIEEPIIPSHILNDIIRKHALTKKILQSNPDQNKIKLLSTKLHECMKALIYIYTSRRIDAYHQIIVRAYTELTWRLLHKIPDCSAKTTAMQSLYNEWYNINLQPLNLQPLFDGLKAQIKNNRILYSNPLVLKNSAFCNQIIKNQCNTLHHLLSLHRTNKHDQCKQYWIGKAAGTILKLISEISITRKPEQQFLSIFQKWQTEQLDIASLLGHITKRQTIFPLESAAHIGPKLQPEQTVTACFDMLPVLIDLYKKHAVPPTLLKRVINPIEIIVKTLFEVLHINEKQLSSEQQQIVTRANAILKTPEDTYTLTHTLLKADRMCRTDKNKAKTLYINASEHIMQTYETGIVYDPIIRDRIYSRLLSLYECNTPFSPEDCMKLHKFATFINMPLPYIIKLQADIAKERNSLNRPLLKP